MPGRWSWVTERTSATQECPALPSVREPEPSIPKSGTYTAAAFADLMARRLEEIAARVGNDRMVRVKGVLPEIPPAYHGVIYDARLEDTDSPTHFVLLEVRPSALREVQPGDTVIASGSIVTNLYTGQLKLRLRADRVELAEPPEEREQRMVQLPVLHAVRQAGGVRRRFPNVPSPTVALLRMSARTSERCYLDDDKQHSCGSR